MHTNVAAHLPISFLRNMSDPIQKKKKQITWLKMSWLLSAYPFIALMKVGPKTFSPESVSDDKPWNYSCEIPERSFSTLECFSEKWHKGWFSWEMLTLILIPFSGGVFTDVGVLTSLDTGFFRCDTGVISKSSSSPWSKEKAPWIRVDTEHVALHKFAQASLATRR